MIQFRLNVFPTRSLFLSARSKMLMLAMLMSVFVVAHNIYLKYLSRSHNLLLICFDLCTRKIYSNKTHIHIRINWSDWLKLVFFFLFLFFPFCCVLAIFFLLFSKWSLLFICSVQTHGFDIHFTRTQFGDFSSFFASSFFFFSSLLLSQFLFIKQYSARTHTKRQRDGFAHTHNVYMANKYTIAYIILYYDCMLARILFYSNSFEIFHFKCVLQVVFAHFTIAKQKVYQWICWWR